MDTIIKEVDRLELKIKNFLSHKGSITFSTESTMCIEVTFSNKKGRFTYMLEPSSSLVKNFDLILEKIEEHLNKDKRVDAATIG